MTTNNKNHYEFTTKPPFTVIGKVYPDSIDWLKDKVDPYSLARRYTGVLRTQVATDKSRERTVDATFNTTL